MFRKLKANEIDCRVANIKENGLSLLLYKDARVDMRILDEAVGPMNWQKKYSRDNANCTVSLWDEKKAQWISKEDTGTESNTEAEKGLASDSFKRACFNWGIGRELYTAPFIWITPDKCNITQGRNGKLSCYDQFSVKQIAYDEDGVIDALVIFNENTGREVYTMGRPKSSQAAPNPAPKRPAAKKAAPKEEPVPTSQPALQAAYQQMAEPEQQMDLQISAEPERINRTEAAALAAMLKPNQRDYILQQAGVQSLFDLTPDQYVAVIKGLKEKAS